MRIETLCEPGSPDRRNEDALFLQQVDGVVLAAAIDGATERIPSTGLPTLLEVDYADMTSAAFAARVTRDALREHSDLPPREMLVAANNRLRAALESVYGPLSPQAIFDREPGLSDWAHDLRYVRMVLPACVVTLIRYDTIRQQLEYAHLGDTALMFFQDDGTVQMVAGHDGRVSSQGTLGMAQRIQQTDGLPHLRDAVAHATVIKRNLEGALYHNYVDEHEQLDPLRGVGVIDGLREAEAFIKTGALAVDASTTGILVFTDGLMWPAEFDESPAQVQHRLQHMCSVIEGHGLRGYYDLLRTEETNDAQFDRYPRFKLHDDATGIYVYH